MDLTVPGGLEGKDTIKHLLNINPEIKVLVASGYSNDPVLVEFSNYGFKGRILKLFSYKQLKEEISKIIQYKNLFS